MSQTRANFLMLIASLIWGTAFVSQTTGMGTIGPFTFSFSRFFFATIAVLPVALYFEANNFSKIFSECVTIAPPSPVVKTLFPVKLNTAESAIEPDFLPFTEEPSASAASSITLRPYFLANNNKGSISTGRP